MYSLRIPWRRWSLQRRAQQEGLILANTQYFGEKQQKKLNKIRKKTYFFNLLCRMKSWASNTGGNSEVKQEGRWNIFSLIFCSSRRCSLASRWQALTAQEDWRARQKISTKTSVPLLNFLQLTEKTAAERNGAETFHGFCLFTLMSQRAMRCHPGFRYRQINHPKGKAEPDLEVTKRRKTKKKNT